MTLNQGVLKGCLKSGLWAHLRPLDLETDVSPGREEGIIGKPFNLALQWFFPRFAFPNGTRELRGTKFSEFFWGVPFFPG